MFPEITFSQFLFFELMFVIIWSISIIIHEFGHYIPAYIMGFKPKINIISTNHFQVEYHSNNLRVLQRLMITSMGVISGFTVLLFWSIVLFSSDVLVFLMFGILPLIGYLWCARGDVIHIFLSLQILKCQGNILLKDEP